MAPVCSFQDASIYNNVDEFSLTGIATCAYTHNNTTTTNLWHCLVY